MYRQKSKFLPKFVGFTFAILMANLSSAQAACTLPYTITNGQPADASQVMANYNAIITCLGTTVAPGTAGQIGYYPSNGSSLSGTDLSSLLDASMGSTQGSILFRDATGWKVLPPGTRQQFLQTLGTGANPQWVNGTGGGDFTKLAQVKVTSAQTTIDFPSISSSYADLVFVFSLRGTVSATSADLRATVNGDSGNNYDWITENRYGTASGNNVAYMRLGDAAGATSLTGTFSGGTVEFYDYADTTHSKTVGSNDYLRLGNGAAGSIFHSTFSAWHNLNPAISRVTFTLSSGNFDVGSVITLYGRGS